MINDHQFSNNLDLIFSENLTAINILGQYIFEDDNEGNHTYEDDS